MDFEEFLWATGNDMLMDLIRKMYAERKPMGQVFHRQAMDAKGTGPALLYALMQDNVFGCLSP